jgi:D-inositol-3-phosphate glycosyltransferase
MPAPSPLRVAVVALHTSPYAVPGSGDVGGMNVLIRATAERMADSGHHVEVITRRSSPSQPSTVALSPRLTLRYIDAGPAEPRPKAEHEAFVEEFRRGLDALGPVDIVHSHHWLSGMAALPFARHRGVPHVQSFHSIAAHTSTSLSEGERPESPGRMAGEVFTARHSDAVVAVSHAERLTILDRLGAPAGRVHVVLPGVDASLFHPGAKTVRPRRYVVAAARIEPLKGLDLAIRTIAAVDPRDRPDLVIAGGPTADSARCLTELKDLARDLGVEARVRFVGPQTRDDLAELLAHASAALIPSHSETYGLVALEAAASGAPVLATPTGGLREAVTADSGILLDSRDPLDWATQLTSLLTDAPRLARLSASARRYAESRGWTRSTQETIAVYCSLLPSRCGAMPVAV